MLIGKLALFGFSNNINLIPHLKIYTNRFPHCTSMCIFYKWPLTNHYTSSFIVECNKYVF